MVAGKDQFHDFYLLGDRSVQGRSPAGWASAAVKAYHEFGADAIVIEVNQGGDMAVAVLKHEDPNANVIKVRASRGKNVRAEPVAALYEQGRVHHVGYFADLEVEMTDFDPSTFDDSLRSFDRLDALVWAITSLAGDELAEPRVRRL
jgi:phage terminase large subunit-like protein